jgi:hypothetical protein
MQATWPPLLATCPLAHAQLHMHTNNCGWRRNGAELQPRHESATLEQGSRIERTQASDAKATHMHCCCKKNNRTAREHSRASAHSPLHFMYSCHHSFMCLDAPA